MGRRVHLGRVLGVDVSIDWSCVFTFILAAWTLATIGERVLPTLGGAALTLLSAVAAIGLFASLVVHEIAHGLAARACGAPVRSITIFSFGGITDVERAPASPRSEAISAVVAPFTNAGIGTALFAIVAALGGLPTYEAAVQRSVTLADMGVVLLAWLAYANVGIALLNLLPAFPLDGGRLVRAAIWRRTGDVQSATRWAALGGQLVGWSMLMAGVYVAVVQRGLGVAGGMWLAFVGWFLASSAAQAYQALSAILLVARREHEG